MTLQVGTQSAVATFDGSQDAAGFPAGNNLQNNYTVDVPIDATANTITFTWGNQLDPEPCSLTLPYHCNNGDSKDFPSQQQVTNSLFNLNGIALPPAGQTVTEPSTGVTIQCLDVIGTHAYSTRPAFNRDCTKFVTSNGTIYDATNYQPLTTVPTNSEFSWSANDPNVLYGISAGMLVVFNCATGQTINTGISGTSIGSFEGYITANESTVFGVGGTAASPAQLCHYNLSNPANPLLLGCINTPAGFDNAKVSISGNCIAVDTTQGGLIYSAGFQTLKDSTDVNIGHSMWGTCNGQDVFIYKDNTNGGLRAWTAATGNEYTLLAPAYGGGSHYSFACDRDGVMYGSFGHTTGGGFVGAFGICPGDDWIEPWSDSYADQNSSFAQQPKASVSKDGNKIVFTSDNGPDGQLRDYVAFCPDN